LRFEFIFYSNYLFVYKLKMEEEQLICQGISKKSMLIKNVLVTKALRRGKISYINCSTIMIYDKIIILSLKAK